MNSFATTLVGGALSAVLLSACVPSALNHLPPEDRAEAGRRKARCDELARALRPSHDRGAGISILGTGVNFRDGLQNQNSARDQYLAALSGLITSCRSWQNFEIPTSEFRSDRLKFAAVYTASIDAGDEATSRASLMAALSRVEADTTNGGLQDAIRRFEEAANSWTPAPDLSQQLTAIADRLQALEARGAGPDLSDGSMPGDGRSSVPVDVSSLDPKLILRFPTRGSTIDATMSAEIASRSPELRDSRYVVVLGYADLAGSSAANAALSLERAQAVAGLLRGLGVRVTHVAGAGETAEFGENPDANRLAIVLTPKR